MFYLCKDTVKKSSLKSEKLITIIVNLEANFSIKRKRSWEFEVQDK